MCTISDDRERLTQSGTLADLKRQYSMAEMVTVYLADGNRYFSHGIYCALIPSSNIEASLSNVSWDLHHGGGKPGAVVYHQGDQERVQYHRYGDDYGIEPLVIDREFHGLRPDYREISEEFRLFHDLYYDQQDNCFYKFDEAGNEHLIAKIEPNRIRIRLKELRQFLAIKEMHLAIQFDCRENSKYTLSKLGLNDEAEEVRNSFSCHSLAFADFGVSDSTCSFSRLIGKRLIPPVDKEKSGIWGYAKEEPQKYVDFIIGVDNDGNEISYTSNPNVLGNFFGANSDAPQYLTPVHFRKQVLDKYYQQSSKYAVESGVLRCGYLWSVYIDNHLQDRVVVWLGDLGRDMPYEEQLHWRSYNIVPVGGVSETFYKRQILAEFADSDQPEHQFCRTYSRLSAACAESLGWQLLIPLVKGDQHYFHAIRILSDEQKAFDELALASAKILIDSLNEKKLTEMIPKAERDSCKGGISKLERVFKARAMLEHEKHIDFLRDLQELRSSGSAHRKGRNYKKVAAKFGLNDKPLSCVLREILVRGNNFLEYLESVVRGGQMK